MLHVVDYIMRYRYPMNDDILYRICFSKLKINNYVKLTNKQKDTLSFDISRQISEEDIVDQKSTLLP